MHEAVKVYEYLVMLDETRNADGVIRDPAEMIVKPTTILAKDSTQANMLAAQGIDKSIMEDPEKFDRLTVVVRPF